MLGSVIEMRTKQEQETIPMTDLSTYITGPLGR